MWLRVETVAVTPSLGFVTAQFVRGPKFNKWKAIVCCTLEEIEILGDGFQEFRILFYMCVFYNNHNFSSKMHLTDDPNLR